MREALIPPHPTSVAGPPIDMPPINLRPLNVEQSPQPMRNRTFDQSQVITVVVLTTLLWFISLYLGISMHDGVRPPKPKGFTVLHSYDVVFRSAGALIPFALLAMRMSSSFITQGKPFQGHESTAIVYIYIVMTVIRAVVYNILLWAGNSAAPGYRVFISDHIFLGACIYAEVLCEACILLRIIRGRRTKPAMQTASLFTFTLACVVLVLTCGEVYNTARHYHHKFESVSAAVAGFVMFQMPISWWLSLYLPLSPAF